VTAVAVADAGPLIHLAEIDSLGLFSAFDQLYVPETVHTDCCESVPLRPAVSGVTAAQDPVVWHHHPK
jgi:hypothetical protein